MVWAKMPDDPGLWKPFTEFGCKILLARRPNHNFDWRCVYDTYRLIRRVRCDVFHCHNVHTSPLIAAALAGVPVRLWSKLAMSPYYERGIEPKGLHRLAPSVRVSCALAHRVLAISNAVRDELLRQRVPAGRVTVMPVPIEVGLYAEASADGVRQGLGLEGSHILITSVGHAVPVKGWDLLIEAFASFARTVPHVHLLLVGSTTGPDEATFASGLRTLVQDSQIAERVHFLNQRGDIPQILRASDIFAFPSRSDGQGLALTEALAAGLPCVAARAGGIPEVITHRDNGLLFDREDVKGLTDALMDVLRNPSLRRRLAERGQASVRRFGLDEYTSRVVALYDELFKE